MVLSSPTVRGYSDPEVGAGGDATLEFTLTLTTAATSPMASPTYDLEMTAL